MQAHHYGRVNAYHGPKQQLLGAKAGQAAPAWRGNQAAIANGKPAGLANSVEKGSKIMLSRLPMDVSEAEVQQLFEKTVGPVKECFVVYNSQAKSKGMAVVAFHRGTDAVLARQKYNGKIVDGKRPIKIEIIADDEATSSAAPKSAPAQPQVPSLLQRLGGKAPVGSISVPTAPQAQSKAKTKPVRKLLPIDPAPKTAPARAATGPKAKLRTKKGPKRVKKAPATIDQLDKEMDEYRASAA